MEMPWPIVVFFIVFLILRSVEKFIDKLFEDK